MSIRFDEIGGRLRAYRLGMSYTATEIAQKIGVSRAAVYRLEKGELVKIETLESWPRRKVAPQEEQQP